MNRKGLKRRYLSQLLVVLLLVVLVNVLGSFRFFRIDLTSEKRFSLAPETQQILRNLDDVVYVRVYLGGDLPSDLIRFRQSIKETLDEFRAYAGKNLEYEFINPYEEENQKIRNREMQNLAGKGLKPTDIRLRDKEGGYTTRIIFPGAIITYEGIDFPVNLLKNNPGLPYQINLNNSIESLEYEFIRAIKSLTAKKIEKVGFIRGHGELGFLQTYDIGKELSLFFDVKWTRIDGNLDKLMQYKALIIAQPLKPFPERDKFALDQYIMRGGRVLFFLDPVRSNADSLVSGRTFTSFLDLNLYDLLFKYGFRIDYNLIKDLQCSYVKVESSLEGQNPQPVILPWVYYPLLSPPQNNFLTRGLNYIKTEFVSAIDTTPAPIPGVKRTVLLSSSDSSELVENPVYISMNEITSPIRRGQYNRSHLPVAILSEGSFPSFYKNYGIPKGVTPSGVRIVDKSKKAMIFVTGDGDMIRNDVRITPSDTIPQPLGYDRDTRQTYGNKEFIMNVINYMTDDMGLIRLRARDFKLRLLDRARIRAQRERVKWELINTLLPVLVILLGGLTFNIFRKKKYGRSKQPLS